MSFEIPSSSVFFFILLLLFLFVYKYNKLKEKYDNIIDIENEIKKKKEELHLRIKELSEIDTLIDDKQKNLNQLKRKIVLFEKQLLSANYHISLDRKSDKEPFLSIYNKIEAIRREELQMIADNKVVFLNFKNKELNENEKEYLETIFLQYSLLIIKYFNREFEIIMSNIKNCDFIEVKKIIEEKFYNTLNSNISKQDIISFNSVYLNLKIKEAELIFNLEQL